MIDRAAAIGCLFSAGVLLGCAGPSTNRPAPAATMLADPTADRDGVYVDIAELESEIAPAQVQSIVARQPAEPDGVDGSILIVGRRGGSRPYGFRWTAVLTLVVTQPATAPPVWNPNAIGWSIEDAIEKAVASRVVVYDHHGVPSRLVPGAGVAPVEVRVSYPPLRSRVVSVNGRTVEVVEFPFAADVAPSRIAVTRGWSTFTDKRCWIEDPQSKSERRWRFGPAQAHVGKVCGRESGPSASAAPVP